MDERLVAPQGLEPCDAGTGSGSGPPGIRRILPAAALAVTSLRGLLWRAHRRLEDAAATLARLVPTEG